MEIKLSIIIPAYNEEKRLGLTLEKITAFLKKQPFASEVIVADDGSRDRSAALAREKLEGFQHQVLETPANEGKGSAVRRGMLAACGKYRLFTDADLSTPIEEAPRFLKFLEEGYDAVIGSRGLSNSNVEVPQNALREAMGRIFNVFARLLAFRGIRDSQCGFKAFTAKAAEDLFRRQKLNGFSFDVEIVFLAQRRGYKLLETPVTWRNSEQSRVKLLSDPFAMFLDLLKIRWLHRHD